MARASKTVAPAPVQPDRVEYDGCYLITAISKTGQVFKTYSRGYKLKSWLAFEQSLGSAATYQTVTEAEFEKHQWYNQPYTDEETVIKPKKTQTKATKTPVKTVVKKPQKTTTKTVVKKPQKKAAKKS